MLEKSWSGRPRKKYKDAQDTVYNLFLHVGVSNMAQKLMGHPTHPKFKGWTQDNFTLCYFCPI